MTRQAELVDYLCDSQMHPLSKPLAHWTVTSPRFALFAETYRDKIRKKIRVASQPEQLLDLRSELEVACCLLNDPRLALSYEPYAREKRRGPDFAVTYRANLVFNVEVARTHSSKRSASEASDGPDVVQPLTEERLLRILLYKLGQMMPGMPNLLVIHTPGEIKPTVELSQLMQGVKTRAEGKDSSFYAAVDYKDPAAFFKDFLRLNGILLWMPEVQLWINKQARPLIDEKILRQVRSVLSGCRRNM